MDFVDAARHRDRPRARLRRSCSSVARLEPAPRALGRVGGDRGARRRGAVLPRHSGRRQRLPRRVHRGADRREHGRAPARHAHAPRARHALARREPRGRHGDARLHHSRREPPVRDDRRRVGSGARRARDAPVRRPPDGRARSACSPTGAGSWTREEIIFLCWTRETGVVPAALAGIIVAEGVDDADLVVVCVALAIIVTLTLQASTKRWLAQRLGLIEEDRCRRRRGRISSGPAGLDWHCGPGLIQARASRYARPAATLGAGVPGSLVGEVTDARSRGLLPHSHRRGRLAARGARRCAAGTAARSAWARPRFSPSASPLGSAGSRRSRTCRRSGWSKWARSSSTASSSREASRPDTAPFDARPARFSCLACRAPRRRPACSRSSATAARLLVGDRLPRRHRAGADRPGRGLFGSPRPAGDPCAHRAGRRVRLQRSGRHLADGRSRSRLWEARAPPPVKARSGSSRSSASGSPAASSGPRSSSLGIRATPHLEQGFQSVAVVLGAVGVGAATADVARKRLPRRLRRRPSRRRRMGAPGRTPARRSAGVRRGERGHPVRASRRRLRGRDDRRARLAGSRPRARPRACRATARRDALAARGAASVGASRSSSGGAA